MNTSRGGGKGANAGSCRWLWLTLAAPDPPTNGQFIYSRGSIAAAEAAGIALDFVALARPEAGSSCLGAQAPNWWLGTDGSRSRWSSLISTLPHMANRANTASMQSLLRRRLARGDEWDAIVFDGLGSGWALRTILSAVNSLRRRPYLLYLAHDHETGVARRIAAVHPHPIKRQLARFDAVKVARLERAMTHHMDLITTDSPDDCAMFRKICPTKAVEWLPPVFLGSHVAARHIGPAVPRRAVIVGSFDWLPKRVNLVEFLRVADPLFAACRVELEIVGAAERGFVDALRSTMRATTFTGPIVDPARHLAAARIGIVAERIGGGFKMKTLDYVFNRVPIVALTGTIPGLPVQDGVSAFLCSDFHALARTVIAIIDDFDTLNRMHERAYAASRILFNLSTAGQVLQTVGRPAASIMAAASTTPKHTAGPFRPIAPPGGQDVAAQQRLTGSAP